MRWLLVLVCGCGAGADSAAPTATGVSVEVIAGGGMARFPTGVVGPYQVLECVFEDVDGRDVLVCDDHTTEWDVLDGALCPRGWDDVEIAEWCSAHVYADEVRVITW